MVCLVDSVDFLLDDSTKKASKTTLPSQSTSLCPTVHDGVLFPRQRISWTSREHPEYPHVFSSLLHFVAIPTPLSMQLAIAFRGKLRMRRWSSPNDSLHHRIFPRRHPHRLMQSDLSQFRWILNGCYLTMSYTWAQGRGGGRHLPDSR